MKDVRTYEIPYQLMDLYRLERFFEEKARKGYLLKRITMLGRKGEFKRIQPGEYHFCIDLYTRRAVKAVRESDDFKEYLEACKSQGWEYCTCYENLVVFYSQRQERPLELQTDDELKMELLKQTALKNAGRQMLLRVGLETVYMFILFGFWGNLPVSGVYTLDLHGWGKLHVWFTSIFYVVLLSSMAAGDLISYFTLADRIRKGKPLPERPWLWTSLFVEMLVMGLYMLSSLIYGLQYGVPQTAFWGLAGICFCILYTLYRYRRPSKKASYRDGWEIMVPLICLFFLIVRAMPFPDQYRFQNGGFGSGYSMKETENQAKETALTFEAMGWESEHTAFFSYDNRPSSLALSETAAYWTEYNLSKQSDPVKERRYIGTLTIRLKDENDWLTCLGQKGIPTNSLTPIHLTPNLDSYLCSDQKTLIHHKETLLIIHFLNAYRPETFNLSSLSSHLSQQKIPSPL